MNSKPILGAAVMLLLAGCTGFQKEQAGADSAACNLRVTLHELWADHVMWTRDYIIAAVNKTADVKAAETRLMKNQDDIGNAIASVYGKEAGDTLTTLLKEHIKIAGDLVGALIANEQGKAKELDNQWHENAKEIAKFLSKANSNWNYDGWVSMLNEHLKFTADEVGARINKKWDADVAAFDHIRKQAAGMADELTNGILKQQQQKAKA